MKLSIALAFLAISLSAYSESAKVIELKIKNHKFEPAEIYIDKDTTVELVVTNEDKTAEEFESKELRKEKIIPGGKTVRMKLNGLKPGEYKFFGEFHEDTAQGKIIVK